MRHGSESSPRSSGPELPERKGREVLVLGGTGYIGRALIRALVARAHGVRALVREGSEPKVPSGAAAIRGSALNSRDIATAARPGDTVVQLVGTPHPSPRKAAEFERTDLASGIACVDACRESVVGHVVYVSVAHPAPTMHAYIAARQKVEAAITAARLPATILRPWYVLGPGHRWPLLLVPMYAMAERIPSMRATARRLGLVTHSQMVAALVHAVESAPPPPGAPRVMDVERIRQCDLRSGVPVIAGGNPPR